MRNKLVLAFFCFLLFVTGQLNAKWKYHSLTNANGLSNSSVTCVFQDSRWNMWIGTWDGLNVYNGREIQTFKFEHNNSNSLSNNIVRAITEDNQGNIWVATDYGINCIHSQTNQIDRYYPGYERDIHVEENTFALSIAEDGQVFFSARKWGIAWLDKQTNQIQPLTLQPFATRQIRGLYCLGGNALLLHTEDQQLFKAYYRLNAENQMMLFDVTPLLGQEKMDYVYEGRTAFFLITPKNGLFTIDKESGEILSRGRIPLAHPIKALAQMSSPSVMVAAGPSELYRFDYETGLLTPMEGLQALNVLSLYWGSQDILWVGCDGQGVVSIYDDNTQFEKVTQQQMFSSRYCPVRAFYQAPTGALYVGSKGNGLFVRNSDGTTATYNMENGLSNNAVYSLAGGYDNDVFIGHDGQGLDVLSLNTGRIQTITPAGGHSFGSVYAICKDTLNHLLWLGTNGHGLIGLELEKKDGKYEIRKQLVYQNNRDDSTSISNNSIFSIIPDNDGRLWVGTRGGGLNLFDVQSGIFKVYQAYSSSEGLSSNDVLSLYESDDETLWIGTSYGLNALHYKDGKYWFEWFLESDGLPNNTIHGILEDADNNLWLSTNHGLSRFNTQTHVSVNYNNNNELQNNEFSDGAYYKNPNGVFYFGGIDGYNYFDPSAIVQNAFEPEIVFTNIYIKEQPMALPKEGRMELRHSENFFTITFSSIEYKDNWNCEYAYMLEGFRDEWTYSGTSNRAVFTNVPPGTYRFFVKGTNSDKIWSPKMATITIRIRPPWWNTIAAYIGYVVFLILIAQIIIRVAKHNLDQRHALDLEQLSQKMQRETYEAKLRFFTNVAHEFSTPLTLIYGASGQLLNNYGLNLDVNKNIKIINSNATRMQRLISELMEFRRVETTNVAPRYAYVNVKELIQNVMENFSDLNTTHRIRVQMTLPEDACTIVSDKGALEKICYNLVSNAYKYTPSMGLVEVSLIRQDGMTVLEVSNSGKGIKAENIGRVFNRFEILDHLEQQALEGRFLQNGIGLALAKNLAESLSGTLTVASETNIRTTFTLSLPDIAPDKIDPQVSPVDLFQDSFGNSLDNLEKMDREEDLLTPPTRQETPSAPERTIMVVDDESAIRDLLNDVLSAEYKVVMAQDGQQAIERLKQERPDLIITDICMPNMDGLEFVSRIKSNELIKHVPVVFLSCKSDIDNQIQGLDMGCEAYISKPFHPKHLLAVVRHVLESRSMLKNYFNSTISTADIYDGKIVDENDKLFMTQVVHLVEKNLLNDQLSADFLSERLSMSTTQFYRKIKKMTDMAPGEFIRSLRLNHAAQLLKTTRLTVLEVMFQSGFNNKSYFYREFLKVYQMPPNEFRENSKNTIPI